MRVKIFFINVRLKIKLLQNYIYLYTNLMTKCFWVPELVFFLDVKGEGFLPGLSFAVCRLRVSISPRIPVEKS